MKKSVCTSGFKDWPLEKIIEWAQPLGIQGLELWMGHIDRFQEEHGPLDKLKDQIQKHGFEIPIISGYTFFSSGFSGEHDIQQEFNSMKKLLDVARQLGSPMVRTFAGHKSSKDASPEQWGQMVSHFKKVMEIADQYEVNIGVEVHYNTFADRTESMKQLILEVDHPRLKTIFDGANLKFERIDQMEAFLELYNWIAHVHFKNYKWDHENWYKTKAVPVFEGDIDNVALLKELKRRNYKGFISLEYFGEDKVMNTECSLIEWDQHLA
ncbi:sugar phosphate isomerase/epimerase family protein [Halalkalibacterium ligniniphilum]|uniref:sugar phosphate isomerase/epimerase family protein n=1 Tax=Halalkalibacterium ligniniphilum TaxID=1134413 RepID=UPI000349C984|nr:sugar phosphate isomerase/epimerase family protein [Halalkalibacterium ligniniphilum]